MSTRQKIIVLGGSGMLGSMVVDALSRDSDLTVTATIRNPSLLEKLRKRLPMVIWCLFDANDRDLHSNLKVLEGQDWIVNAIGITKPLIRDDDPFEVERAIWINSLLPHVIGSKAATIGARVLQIATDCVYSGIRGAYSETDMHDPLDVYGKTKSLGESWQENIHHIRCSIIGPEPKENKFLLEWFRCQPSEARINGYINHIWNGVTTLHFSKICQGIIKSNIILPHLQHVVPRDKITKAEMLRCFAQAYKRQDIMINDVEAKNVIDRTLITNNHKLNNLLWEAAGYLQPPTVSEIIGELSHYDYRLEGLV